MLRKHNELPRPYLLQLRPAARIGFLFYAVIVNIFLAFYLFYMIPMLVYKFVGELPEEIYQLVLCLSGGVTPPFSLLHNIFSQVLFFSVIIYMFVRMVKPYFNKDRLHNESR